MLQYYEQEMNSDIHNNMRRQEINERYIKTKEIENKTYNRNKHN